jgi:hypothetical protein
MPNDNCLADMQCPTCGAYAPFWIEVMVVCKVTDEGTDLMDHNDNIDWDPESFCMCDACGMTGIVQTFSTQPEGA